VVKALIGLMKSSKAIGRVFNVGSEDEITILNLAKRVKKVTGSKSKIVHIPYQEAYESGFEDMRRRVPSIKKVNKLIGWKPQIGLDRIIKRIKKEERK